MKKAVKVISGIAGALFAWNVTSSKPDAAEVIGRKLKLSKKSFEHARHSTQDYTRSK